MRRPPPPGVSSLILLKGFKTPVPPANRDFSQRELSFDTPHDDGLRLCASRSSGSKPRSARGTVLAAVPAESGDRSWGQVGGFSGGLRAHQGRGAAGSESRAVAGKSCKQALLVCLPPAARNLHGKEAVPGSSPGEGLNTCKSPHFEDCRVPPDQGGLANPAAEGQQNSPQIATHLIQAEHLPTTEGLAVVAFVWSTEIRWNRRHSGSRHLAARRFGDRFWGQGRAVGVPLARV